MKLEILKLAKSMLTVALFCDDVQITSAFDRDFPDSPNAAAKTQQLAIEFNHMAADQEAFEYCEEHDMMIAYYPGDVNIYPKGWHVSWGDGKIIKIVERHSSPAAALAEWREKYEPKPEPKIQLATDSEIRLGLIKRAADEIEDLVLLVRPICSALLYPNKAKPQILKDIEEHIRACEGKNHHE